MTYGLPAHGATDWDTQLNDSIDHVKNIAEAAAVKANNLSDLTNVTLARTNLGLGSAATAATTAFDPAGAASSAQAAAVQRANHTGTQSADTLTDGTTNKAYTGTERTKLGGIAAGATVNDTDANLKNRANHTGTQAISTIDFLQSTLDTKLELVAIGDQPAATVLSVTYPDTARPTSDATRRVFWLFHPTQPAGMLTNDVWLKDTGA